MRCIKIILLLTVLISLQLKTEGNNRLLERRLWGEEPIKETESGPVEINLPPPRELVKRALKTTYNLLNKISKDSEKLGIRNTDDVIRMVRRMRMFSSMKSWFSSAPEPLSDRRAKALIQTLSEKPVQIFLDRTIQQLPRLPRICKGIQWFFEGPDAEPLFEAVRGVVPQQVTVPGKSDLQLGEYLNKAMEGIEYVMRIFEEVSQSSQVDQVFHKLRALPEVNELDEIFRLYGVTLSDYQYAINVIYYKLRALLSEM